ncbi:MAG: response regulator, partial [Candidatus Promineifilaceae bacterium]
MDQTKRILVVDDHYRVLDSIKAMLEATGLDVEVIGVPSAEEGFLEIRRRAVDLLVTDIYLPGMSGAELIVRVHKLLPELPIIVITGHAEKMRPEEAASSGIVAYFEKPVQPRGFIEAVSNILIGNTLRKEMSEVGGNKEMSHEEPLALRFLVETLRANTGSAEVLLGTVDGVIHYMTGRRDSALSVLAEHLSEAVMGLNRLADRMGCDSYHLMQTLTDDQLELFIVSQGHDLFIAVLYHAGSRIAETAVVISKARETLASASVILQEAPPQQVNRIPPEPIVGPELSSPQRRIVHELSNDEADELFEALDVAAESSALEDQTLDLPGLDSDLDLDAFWDNA